jgi:hypothetical protein
MKGNMMKSLSLKILVLALIISASARVSFAGDRTIYGERIKEGAPVSITDALATPDKFEGQSIIIEGMTGSVCQTKGCWMYLEDGKNRVRVVFKDYAFFVAMDSQGKKARAQGLLSRKVVKKEVLQHWAEEGGEDPSKIEGDMPVVILTASGVEIEGGSDLSPEQKSMMSEDKNLPK